MEQLNDFIAWITGDDVKNFINVALTPMLLTLLSLVISVGLKKLISFIFDKFTNLFNNNKDLLNEYKVLGDMAYETAKATYEKMKELTDVVNTQDKTINKQDKLLKVVLAISPISVQQKTAILDILLDDTKESSIDDQKFVKTLLDVVKGDIEHTKEVSKQEDMQINEAIAKLDNTEV